MIYVRCISRKFGIESASEIGVGEMSRKRGIERVLANLMSLNMPCHLFKEFIIEYFDGRSIVNL